MPDEEETRYQEFTNPPITKYKVPKDQEQWTEGTFGPDPPADSPTAPITKWANWFGWIVDGPVTWWREKVILPNRRGEKYYHMRFNRVPTIDECYTDDIVCIAEADDQYRRDRRVDTRIVNILQNRYVECLRYHGFDESNKCNHLRDEFMENYANWYIKYGDMSMYYNCAEAYYKQLHRMIWERRQKEKQLKENGNSSN